MKKDSGARAKGAANANKARTAWEDQALAIYAQFLHEKPKLKPKERRYAVTKWMNDYSIHHKRITDAMMLAALRRPEAKGTLAALKEMFEAPDTALELPQDEEAEIAAVAKEMTRFVEARYSEAFGQFAEATAAFRAACIEASRGDDFAGEVDRAVKMARDKAPARAKRGATGK